MQERESAREQERDGGEKERGRWRDIEGEFSERERERDINKKGTGSCVLHEYDVNFVLKTEQKHFVIYKILPKIITVVIKLQKNMTA